MVSARALRAGPEDVHNMSGRFSAYSVLFETYGAQPAYMNKFRPFEGAEVYTHMPVWPQNPPGRPSQAENRAGPVNMHVLQSRIQIIWAGDGCNSCQPPVLGSFLNSVARAGGIGSRTPAGLRCGLDLDTSGGGFFRIVV